MSKEIAMEMFRAFGGTNRLSLMIGAKNLAYNTNEQGNVYITFRFPVKTKNKSNMVRMTLNALDLYDIEFLKLRAGECKTIEKIDNIYAEDVKSIFEDRTACYLSL